MPAPQSGFRLSLYPRGNCREQRENMKRVSFKISIIYLLVGILWIFFSDEVVALFVQDKAIIIRLSIVKGWLFIIITAVMLYWLVTRYVG